jgi:hypothetical protein
MDNKKPGLVHETAKIAWKELQRFYAQGKVFQIADEMDLVKVATAFSEDDSESVGAWTDSGKVKPVPDSQALHWYESDAIVWAVTVAPFVLVQAVLNKH